MQTNLVFNISFRTQFPIFSLTLEQKDFSIRRFVSVTLCVQLICTTISTNASETTATTIRVRLLSSEKLSQVTLEAYGGLRISSERANGRLTVRAVGNAVELRDNKDLRIVRETVNIASRAGRWIDIQREERRPRRTVGWLQIRSREGRLEIVNVLPLETYVLGVVDGELGSILFNPESLKAQIVASRSYVLASRWRHKRDGFDFCDSPHCQVFGGTASIRADFKMAMEESRGQYLSFRGRPAPGFFHDNCGGKTAFVQDIWKAPAAPFLQSVSDGEDSSLCHLAPFSRWQFSARREELRTCFYDAGWIEHQDALDTLRVIRLNPSSRAHQVLIQSNHPRWVSAREFRRTVNAFFHTEVLKSTYFVIDKTKDGFEFHGKGWGHGVGLCQWGAIAMGRDGKTYREILKHYYPHTVLENLPEPQYVGNPHDHDNVN